MPTHLLRTAYGDVSYALRKRKAGGVWHYRFWLNGTEHRESTKQHDLAQARLVVEKEIHTLQRPVLPGAHGVARLKAAVDHYLNTRWPYDPTPGKDGRIPTELRLQDRHYRDTRSRLGQFQSYLGDDAAFVTLSLDDARFAIQRYVDTRRALKKSARTLHNDQHVISKFCAWMVQRRLASWVANPASTKGLDIPRPHSKPKAAAVVDEIEILLHAARKKAIYPFIILMCSGLRPVGCTRVKWKDIDLADKPVIRVPIEKNEYRTIPLSAWAAEKLAAWKLTNQPSENFLVYASSVNNACRRLRNLRGASAVTFGAMRRMAYTRLYAAGVTPQLAAKIMGNSIQVALKHYVLLETMNAHEAVAALDITTKPAQKPAQDTLTKENPPTERKA